MVQANRNEPLVSTFTVALSVDDKKVATDVMPWIVSASVTDHVRDPTEFSLELISREDESGTTSWTDDERFVLGAPVAVSFCYGSKVELLIAGEITALAPAFSVGGAPTLSVQGQDLRHRLNTVQRVKPAFAARKYSDIAEKICKDQHISMVFEDSGAIVSSVQQACESDLEFLLYCADQIHYELVMQGRTLLFREVSANKPSVATLTLDDDLLEFNPYLSLLPLTGLVASSWDTRKKTPMTASVGDNKAVGMGGTQSAAQQTRHVFGESVEMLCGVSVGSQMELDRVAQARWDAAALDLVTGGGRCRGRTDVGAGRVIRIAGVGKRFSGDYYLESVVHSYTRDDGYATSFQVRRNAS